MKKKLSMCCAVLLLAACAEEGTKSVIVAEPQTEFQFSQTMPTGKIIDENKGEQVWFGLGALSGVEGVPANGVAQMFVFEDGSSQFGLQLNVERPERGYYYEGWLVDSSIDAIISTGHLQSIFGDVRHALQFTDQGDLRDFAKVVITLEMDDGNPDPSSRIAEGVLKEIQR